MLLKLMSLNLRFDKPDPGERNWRVRRRAIAALITHYSPHLIGTQEGKAHQLLDLHRLLPHYRSVGGDRTGTGTDEYCAIFYAEGLQCRDTDDFFLSDTPDIPGSISPQWGNSLPRMATEAVFRVFEVPQPIRLINTHLDYDSARARALGAKLIGDRLGCLPADYYFLTGDFNAAPGTPPRETLQQTRANGIQLNDALGSVSREQQLSFHDFTGQGFDAVDTIYYDSRSELHWATVDASRWQGILPSDHFPVFGEFKL